MKYFLGLVILSIFGLSSCKNNQSTEERKPTFDMKTEINIINNYLKQHEEVSQVFEVSSDKPTQVKGNAGTIISINPMDLVTETGHQVGKNIEIELKELTNQEQLLRTNAQTTANGKLLVSGGAYFINLKSDGKQLKLKDGKKLSVKFPKIATNEMSLFYGQRDTLGQLNWQQSEQKFKSNLIEKTKSEKALVGTISDTFKTEGEIDAILKYVEQEGSRPLTTEEKKTLEEEKKNQALAAKVYQSIDLKQFGWINCDRFYDITNITNLKYTFSIKDSIVSANVYLVFKNINSIMQSSYFSFGDILYNSGFENIPLGEKTQLIALSIKNGKTYSYKSELLIKSNETIQLKLKETSQDQLGKLFEIH